MRGVPEKTVFLGFCAIKVNFVAKQKDKKHYLSLGVRILQDYFQLEDLSVYLKKP